MLAFFWLPRAVALAVAFFLSGSAIAQAATALSQNDDDSVLADDINPKPNIVLIVAEDMSPRVGAYGDPVAQTPNIDALATRGVRYQNVFTAAGVCAPSRSALITGVYPISMGTHQMRTSQGVADTAIKSYEAAPPEDVKAFPELLRKAGYATANFAKKDYQFGDPFTIWDSHTGNFMSPVDPAIWRQLPAGKPFFAMINLMATHESRLVSDDAEIAEAWAPMFDKIKQDRADNFAKVTDPADVVVPPIYPDTAVVRRSIAQHYDNIHHMDEQVGEVIAALEEDGLLESTIVVWTTDHGDAFPRAKRSIYDSGLHVPMVVRYPDEHSAGTQNTQLVSFVDLAPTILGWAGAEVPEFIQGSNFEAGVVREYIFAARDRMDATVDRMRAVRDSRYKYVRNLMPELSYFRPLLFRDMFPIMRELWRESESKEMPEVRRYYFDANRPMEELYDLESDPWEINNLAADPTYAAIRKRLSDALEAHIAEVGDMGEIPEYDMVVKMWGGETQPVTAAPVVEFSAVYNDEKQLTVTGAVGASIGYRINDGPWLLYSQPVIVKAGSQVEVKAQRYGFQISEVISLIAP